MKYNKIDKIGRFRDFNPGPLPQPMLFFVLQKIIPEEIKTIDQTNVQYILNRTYNHCLHYIQIINITIHTYTNYNLL